MPDPITGLLGGGAMLGGGILAHQANQDQAGAIGQAGQWLQDQYSQLQGEQVERFDEIMGQFDDTFTGSLEDFFANMGDVIQGVNTAYDDIIIADYRAGMDESIEAYDVGRQNTLALLEQQTLDSQRRAIGEQSFTGMGGTSFGQAQVAGLGAQGALRAGAVEEQYATGMSQLLAGRTSGLAGLQQQQIGMTTQLGQQAAGAGLTAGMAGGQFAANLGMQGLGQYLNLGTAPLNQMYAGQMQAAAMPSGTGMIGSALGGIGSGLLGGLMG